MPRVARWFSDQLIDHRSYINAVWSTASNRILLRYNLYDNLIRNLSRIAITWNLSEIQKKQTICLPQPVRNHVRDHKRFSRNRKTVRHCVHLASLQFNRFLKTNFMRQVSNNNRQQIKYYPYIRTHLHRWAIDDERFLRKKLLFIVFSFCFVIIIVDSKIYQTQNDD